MNFCSLSYFIFLPIVITLYWQLRGRARVWLLAVASYVFYASWVPVYALLLFCLSTVNWCLGLLSAKAGRFSSKSLLVAGITFNLSVLICFKYAHFFECNLHDFMSFCQHELGLAYPISASINVSPEPSLPLGISFFAFEFIHYLADVERGCQPIKSFAKFLAFSAFFPSQIAGPIKRFQDFERCRAHPESWSTGLFWEAGALIVQGAFKKIALADPLGLLVAPVFATGVNPSAIDAVTATVGFAMQLYCDFSGYTDIGRGSALLMGIRLPSNFALPYLAPDILSFWRRWHMSLSNWLRDYLYIPLGGSHRSASRKYLNLMITMSVCGLWHGAQWHFVIFGLFNGLAMIVNGLWLSAITRYGILKVFAASAFGKSFGYCLCILTWLSGWIIFRAPTSGQALQIFRSLSNGSGQATLFEPLLRSGLLHIAFVYLTFWLTLEWMRRKKATDPGTEFACHHNLIFKSEIRLASWTAAVLLMLAVRPVEAIPFIYFQF